MEILRWYTTESYGTWAILLTVAGIVSIVGAILFVLLSTNSFSKKEQVQCISLSILCAVLTVICFFGVHYDWKEVTRIEAKLLMKFLFSKL